MESKGETVIGRPTNYPKPTISSYSVKQLVDYLEYEISKPNPTALRLNNDKYVAFVENHLPGILMNEYPECFFINQLQHEREIIRLDSEEDVNPAQPILPINFTFNQFQKLYPKAGFLDYLYVRTVLDSLERNSIKLLPSDEQYVRMFNDFQAHSKTNNPEYNVAYDHTEAQVNE